MCGSIAHVDTVEVATGAEHHVRVRVKVRAQETVRTAVFKNARRGERGNCFGIGAIPRAIGPDGQ